MRVEENSSAESDRFGLGGILFEQTEKILVDGRVAGELRVEGGGEQIVFLDQHGFASVFGENGNSGANFFDDWRTDEDHFHGPWLEGRGAKKDIAGKLAAVAVALDGHVEQAERWLRRMLDFFGEENGACAGAKDGPLSGGELLDGVEEALFLKKLELGGGFATGENESVAAAEVGNRADFEGSGAERAQHLSMCGEVALHGQDSDFWRCRRWDHLNL